MAAQHSEYGFDLEEVQDNILGSKTPTRFGLSQMKKIELIVSLLILAGFGGVGNAQVASTKDKDVDAGEIAFLKTRQAIDEMHCRISYKSTVHSPNQKQTAFTMELWASGDRLREDLTRRVSIIDNKTGSRTIQPDEKGVSFREVACVHCEKIGQFFQGDELNNSVKNLGPISSFKRRSDMMFHPRLIGISGCSVRQLHTSKINWYIQAADRSEFGIASEMLDGIRAVKLRWINAHGAQITSWLDPTRGYFPLQFEVREVKSEPDVTKQFYTVSKNHDISPVKWDGTFFPKRITYQEFEAEGVLSKSEEIVIDEIEIGPKIDPRVFTIAGCNFGDSYYIENAESKLSGIWNANQKKVEPLPPERMQRVTAEQIAQYKQITPLIEVPVPLEPQSKRDWLYWLAGGLIAAAAIWLIARVIAKRRSPS